MGNVLCIHLSSYISKYNPATDFFHPFCVCFFVFPLWKKMIIKHHSKLLLFQRRGKKYIYSAIFLFWWMLYTIQKYKHILYKLYKIRKYIQYTNRQELKIRVFPSSFHFLLALLSYLLPLNRVYTVHRT